MSDAGTPPPYVVTPDNWTGPMPEPGTTQQASGPARRNVVVDIDAAFPNVEAEDDPIVVKVLGRRWSFPSTVPTSVVVSMPAWAEGNMTDTAFVTLIGDLIPENYLRQWSHGGLSIFKGADVDPRFVMILDALMREYADRLPAPQLNRAQRRAQR